MSDRLAAGYLEAVETRCRQFQGTWDQGTSGSLAADAFRLLRERRTLMDTIANLERANGDLRAAVEGRIAAAEAACCEGGRFCSPPAEPAEEPVCVSAMDPSAFEAAWAAVKARRAAIAPVPDADQPRRRVFTDAGPVDQVLTPAESLLRTAIDTVRERRGTYGPPEEHFRITVGLLNAAFTDKLRRRLDAGEPAFAIDDWPIVMALDKIARDMGPRPSPDTPIDLAGYAATLAECRRA